MKTSINNSALNAEVGMFNFLSVVLLLYRIRRLKIVCVCMVIDHNGQLDLLN